jgi:putative zinc finger protein
MNTEPELEDLSSYLDQELTGTARQQLEAHLQTCETCRRRLAALRQTVSAVQALPTEAPPRVFTIPPQRQQRRVPAAWAWAGGALAAACLLVVVTTIGLANLPHGGGMATTNAPASRYQGGADRGPTMTVTDPQDTSKQLTISSGSTAFSADQGTTTGRAAAPLAASKNQPLEVGLLLQGVPGDGVPANLTEAHVRLALLRDGYEVALANPDTFSAARENGAIRMNATFRVGSPPLPSPAAGSYVLRVTWQVPDSSGVSLVAQVPVTVTS